MAKTDPFADEDDIVSGINVTPLVDVCLVLVIIFMVTAPMLSEPVIKVELPRAHTKEGEEKEKITITLGKDGRMALDYKEFKTYEAMEADLKDKLLMSESKLVILKADQDARHGKLVELMAHAKDAGAQSLTIATERKK
ncbi:MAG: biopolymer transporter ExbD [Elusimicrobia bacterium]|nr:biopolymer transporter ExbD [Elusimicrobiota bacterium]